MIQYTAIKQYPNLSIATPNKHDIQPFNYTYHLPLHTLTTSLTASIKMIRYPQSNNNSTLHCNNKQTLFQPFKTRYLLMGIIPEVMKITYYAHTTPYCDTHVVLTAENHVIQYLQTNNKFINSCSWTNKHYSKHPPLQTNKTYSNLSCSRSIKHYFTSSSPALYTWYDHYPGATQIFECSSKQCSSKQCRW